MDKDKLIEWIGLNGYKSPVLHLLSLAIEGGKFDKEPCIVCAHEKNKILGRQITKFAYCPMCGRKLEVQDEGKN
jgi:hypothetical protein